jgi:hypothetical protein
MNATFDVVPLWAAFLGTLTGMLLFAELGYRLGGRPREQRNKETEAPVGGMVAAQLGLLAFLLAITFSLAVQRFEERRQVLLDEANAVGTVYLRADMLAEAERLEVRRLLKEYVDLRLSVSQSGSVGSALERSDAIHAGLWSHASAAAKADPRSVPVGLFVESLNDVIDLHATRVQASLRSRLPGAVWFVLLSVAGMSFFMIGYHNGLTTAARSWVVTVVAVAFASVFWLVLNLERPHEGILRLSQQPMIDLRASMR